MSRESAAATESAPPAPQPVQPVVTTGGTAASTGRSLFTADLGWGWYNKFYFRGVNILDSISPNSVPAGVGNVNLTLTHTPTDVDEFRMRLDYTQGFGRQIPQGEAERLPPNINERTKNPRDNEQYDLASRKRYAEYDAYIGYSRLFAEKFRATVGFTHYQFSDASFYLPAGQRIDHADESVVRLDYVAIPHITPSVKWFHDFNGFEGDYVQVRLDGDFDFGQLFTGRPGRIGIRPYVAVSYDFEYNGLTNGWNALEAGVDFPIQLNEYLTFSLTGNYVYGMNDTVDLKGDSAARVSPGFWFGATLRAHWGAYSEPQSDGGKKDIADAIEFIPGDKPWEFSVGAGWRRVDYDFSQQAIGSYDVQALAKRLGKINPDNPDVAAGGAVRGGNTFLPDTRTFSYTKQLHSNELSFDDNDDTFFPYLQADREVWRRDRVSARAGLLYSYTHSQGDSGQRLARLDSLFETRTEVGTLRLNNNPTPVSTTFSPKPTKSEVVRVATFTSAQLEESVHDLAVPISVRYDMGRRAHIELSVAPTLTLLDSQIRTATDRRQLDNNFAEAYRPLASFPSSSGSSALGSPSNIGPDPMIGNPADQAGGEQPPTSSGGAGVSGGKAGGGVASPDLPGKDRGSNSDSSSSLDVLFGVATSASLICDLDDAGKMYFELWAKYHWMDRTTISNGVTSADIDLSGVEAGAGLGFRF